MTYSHTTNNKNIIHMNHKKLTKSSNMSETNANYWQFRSKLLLKCTIVCLKFYLIPVK